MLTALTLFATLFWAELAAQNYPWQEGEIHIQRAREIQALGAEAFGEQVSLQDGTLAFAVTDIDLHGNNSLPVRFGRSYRLFNREMQPTQEMLGDWVVDVPHLRAVFPPDWVSYSGAASSRCSNFYAPPYPQPPAGMQPSATAMAYWEGIDIEIPGVASGELMPAIAGVPVPGGGPYPWVTNDHVRVSCLPSIKNGHGEGFLAITPDGTRYWFDWMAQFAMPGSRQVSPTHSSLPGSAGEWYVIRRRNVLYATRVEDRFGNWVSYTYANQYNHPGRLTQIDSSDGRRINVAWSGAAIASVTATAADTPARTWQYTIALTPAGRQTLTTVTLPDTTRWQIGFNQFTDAEIKYLKVYPAGEPVRSCIDLEMPQNAEFSPVGTLVHPSGATAEFMARIIEHGRTNVTLSCSNIWVVPGSPNLDNDPNDDVNLFPISFHQFSLVRKRLWGPGVPLAEWSYEYQPTQSIFMHPGTTWAMPICLVGAACHQAPVCAGGPCPGSSSTIITDPSGQWTRYIYGNSFKYNEGKLLKVEVGTGPENVLRSVQHDYDYARDGRSYPLRYGLSTKFNGGYSDFVRPLTRTRTAQQGVTFTWEVASCGSPAEPCFDSYLRPARITRSSGPTPPSPPPPPPPPGAPSLTVPGSSNNGAFTVSWTSVATATEYRLEQSINGGDWAQVYAGLATSLARSGLGDGNYGYRVRGCGVGGCGAYSNVRVISIYSNPGPGPGPGPDPCVPGTICFDPQVVDPEVRGE